MSETATAMVVIDPERLVQPALDKARELASLDGAGLRLYCCLSEQAERAADALAITGTRDWLQRIAGTLGHAAVEVESSPDWRQGIAAAARRLRPGVVVKTAARHTPLGRALLATSDWILLRQSPVPVLLVKGSTRWSRGRLLAALQLEPHDEVHEIVNQFVLDAAHSIARELHSELHVVTALHGEQLFFDSRRFAKRCGLPRSHIHAAQGAASKVIARTARELDVDLVVIGTVASNDQPGLEIGGTAEKTLDLLTCDVLAVPPIARVRALAAD